MKKLFRLSLATEFIMKTLFLVTLVTNHTVGELNALLESVGLIKVEKAFYENALCSLENVEINTYKDWDSNILRVCLFVHKS